MDYKLLLKKYINNVLWHEACDFLPDRDCYANDDELGTVDEQILNEINKEGENPELFMTIEEYDELLKIIDEI